MINLKRGEWDLVLLKYKHQIFNWHRRADSNLCNYHYPSYYINYIQLEIGKILLEVG